MPLTDEARVQMEQLYSSIDKSGKGAVTAAELAAAMSNIGGGLDEDACKELISIADMDGDRLMSAEEFLKLVEQGLELVDSQGGGEQMIREEFNNFDQNGDGFIDREELRVAMQGMGEELTDQQLDQMMKAADVDGDHRITMDEFKKMCDQ